MKHKHNDLSAFVKGRLRSGDFLHGFIDCFFASYGNATKTVKKPELEFCTINTTTNPGHKQSFHIPKWMSTTSQPIRGTHTHTPRPERRHNNKNSFAMN